MSLDWNVSKVENFKQRCWVDVPEEQQRHHGKRKLADDTNALVWGAMMVDLGSITIRNIDEWCFRIEVLKRCDMNWMQYFDENDNVVGYYPDRQAVEDHVGMYTNVTTMSRAKWLNKVKRRIEKEAEQSVNINREKLEKERSE